MKIEIIGTESPPQKQLKSYVEDIIHELGLECKLDIIHNLGEVLIVEEKRIMLTPALIIDDKIICQGHIWSKDHIKHFMQQFCSKKEQTDHAKPPDEFAVWKGIPREEIEWAPTIDPDKCTGCGMCVTSCGRDVFDYDGINKTASVVRPLQCMVGCTSCKVWCVFDAISFPDSDRIRTLIKKRGVLKVAKMQLKERNTL